MFHEIKVKGENRRLDEMGSEWAPSVEVNVNLRLLQREFAGFEFWKNEALKGHWLSREGRSELGSRKEERDSSIKRQV